MVATPRWQWGWLMGVTRTPVVEVGGVKVGPGVLFRRPGPKHVWHVARGIYHYLWESPVPGVGPVEHIEFRCWCQVALKSDSLVGPIADLLVISPGLPLPTPGCRAVLTVKGFLDAIDNEED